MERIDDDSSSPVTVNEPSLCHHHHPSSSADVITRGHAACPGARQVTCSGDGEEVASSPLMQCVVLATCAFCSRSDDCPQGPIRWCSDVRMTGDGQGAGPVVMNCSLGCSNSVASCTEGSKVNHCDCPCEDGATRATNLHLDEPTSEVDLNPVTLTSDSDSETLEGDLTSDLPQVISDDDAFITEPPLPGELNLPAVTALSRNTFECARRQSAPGQLVQDDRGSESELQSRRPGIIEYFSRKQRSISHSVAGWKLFGKVPPKQSPSKQAWLIQQEFEARQVAARSSPTHNASGQQSRGKVEFEPLSTTALILEDRPPNLPAKSAEETQRHRQQYEQMVAGAKRKELKEAQKKQQQMKQRVRQEEVISSATLVWNQHILPQWDSMYDHSVRSSRRARDLWWAGLPPSVRGRVWNLAISNELNITAELYEIFLSRAKQKWRNLTETQADGGASLADGESSLELITRDISRTFPSLCVFQKGGPYHDLLQNILGAYTCYRPDVGYVQGMSSTAAMLILNMDEVEAFISFSNLINRPCQLAFYRVDHQLVHRHVCLSILMLRYFGAFQVFFEETLPRLFLHFQSSGLTPDLYLMDWILSLYTKPLPLDVACRIWDVFFRDGEEFLFRTALGILRLYQDVLLHMDLISIAQFLSRLPDEELLSDRLFSCISASPMLSGNRKWSQVLSSYKESETSSC
ncbi:TBC1 domain family member 12-like isoform X2 [Chelmon rostratus]|uniref:TBC1 domain family member 12-like isoform X2 n=1 Tax=Chelmon rostratus TaxID=109905 RepID=UPI001BE4F5FF|nr:TBC1 domain family member 12-like isoform X2 [Chelmon rostratus]